MREIRVLIVVFLVTIFLGCTSVNNGGSGVITNSAEWLVSPVYDGGPGKDGIPALLNPELTSPSQATYLRESDLVIGVVNGSEIRAYPHPILDWHEIINDDVAGKKLAITYCPLTGSGIAYDRIINNGETTFGVSGLLYENNLIPYDRATSSNWSQMRLQCVNGQLVGNRALTFPLIETTWSTWKRMFPMTWVVSTNTGHNRPYGSYPYVRAGGDYRTDHDFVIFPIGFDDSRLRRKDRVHGVIVNDQTKVYPFNAFGTQQIALNDVVNGVPVLVIASGQDNLILSYLRTVSGSDLSFEVATGSYDIYPLNLQSDDGTVWNILGESISGPRTGARLTPTVSYNSYWFAWGSFFRGASIYGQ